MSVATLPPRQAATAAAQPPPRLEEILLQLYRRQSAEQPANDYLRNHGSPRSIANHVRTFHWYRPYLPEAGNVLDWGCQHAPDSCLLRATGGTRFHLFSCDFPEATRHKVFHEFAQTRFTPIQGSERLPYEDQFFDAVIGSGVLEHAARDVDSLAELYRILKPGGILVITYLPNWLSINEWWRRVVRRGDFHRRLYGLGATKQLLKHHGFYPLAARHHTFLWDRFGTPLAGVLATVLPLQLFSSTLCFVVRKMRCM